MSIEDFNREYPALATKKAIEVASKAGMQPNDPRTIITAMHSNTYQKTMEDFASPADSKTNARAMARVARAPTAPLANFDPNNTDVTAGYNAKAAAIQNGRLRQQPYLQAMSSESERLGKLAGFNRETYTNQRLAEMEPTKDIDKAILDLRNRALFSQAAMFDEVKNLPFNLQQTAIAARMKTFTDQIDDLATMRESRIAAAKNQITDEVGTYEGRIASSKARIDGLKSALDILKDQGASEEDLAQLRIDHAREMDKLKKSRAGAGGMVTSEELILNALSQKYMAENGVAPDGGDLAELKRQAKMAARTRPDIVQQVAEAGGDYTAMRGSPEAYTEDFNLGRSVFDPSSWFGARTVPIPKQRLVNPLDRGFGTPARAIGGLNQGQLELMKLANEAAKE